MRGSGAGWTVSALRDQLLLDELVDVAQRPEVVRKLRFLATRLDDLLRELEARAVLLMNAPEVFQYQRDPDDAHYVNLALASGAMLVVSRDRDLIELMDAGNAEGMALRNHFPTSG